MTVEGGQAASPLDHQASLRTELLGQLAAGQFALEAALAELSGADPTVRDQLRSQLSLIAGFRQQIGTTQGSELSKLRSEVTALAGNATAAAQAARTSASADSAASNSIATLAKAARDQVNTVMAGMKDFDPYMRFNGNADEEAYRKREAERQAYIAVEQAKGTPQGDLNAANSAVAQMNDAKAHGADRSPVFEDRMTTLTRSRDELRDAMTRSVPRETALGDIQAPKTSEQPAKGTNDNLDAAMAALREAGVKPAPAGDMIVADTHRAQSDGKTRAPTSVRV